MIKSWLILPAEQIPQRVGPAQGGMGWGALWQGSVLGGHGWELRPGCMSDLVHRWRGPAGCCQDAWGKAWDTPHHEVMASWGVGPASTAGQGEGVQVPPSGWSLGIVSPSQGRQLIRVGADRWGRTAGGGGD